MNVLIIKLWMLRWCHDCLSSSSMVKMVYSVYHGAIKILRGLLPVVEMDSGKNSSFFIDLDSVKSLLLTIHFWALYIQRMTWIYVVLTTVSFGPLMVKSFISTNILLLCLVVTGARTTSKTSPHVWCCGFINVCVKGEWQGNTETDLQKSRSGIKTNGTGGENAKWMSNQLKKRDVF